MPRKSLRPNLNQIRAWVRQGRTDAWVAHQLEVSVRDIEQFKRQNDLVEEDATEATTTSDYPDEIDLRAEDDALIAAELEAAELEAERARAEAEAKAAEAARLEGTAASHRDAVNTSREDLDALRERADALDPKRSDAHGPKVDVDAPDETGQRQTETPSTQQRHRL